MSVIIVRKQPRSGSGLKADTIGKVLRGGRDVAVRAIGAWQWRVAHQRGLRAPRTGAITSVQGFGGLVNLNVHFHLLIPDGGLG